MMHFITTVFAALVVSSKLSEAASQIGWPATNRAYTDSGSGQVFIDKRLVFPYNGKVTEWTMYSRAQGTVYLQVWRPHGDDICKDVELVGQTKVVVDSSNLGLLTIELDPNDQIEVQCGDVIGWNNPGKGVITGDMVNGRQDHCFKYQSPPTVGHSYNLDSVIGWGPQRKYSLLATFEEANVEVGWETVNRAYVDSGSGQVFVDKRFTFPYRGEIIGWNIFTRAKGTVNLQAWSPASEGSCTMTLLGQTEVTVSDSSPHSISIDLDIGNRIAVEEGDTFGWNNPGTGVITGDMVSGSQTHCFKYQSSPAVGQSYALDSDIGWGPSRKYSVQAVFQGLLGWKEVNRAYVDSGSGQVFVDKRLAFPDDGIVTGWQLYSRREGKVSLQIWRPASQGNCDVTLIGQTEVTVDSSNKGFLSLDLDECAEIPVKAGDLIGWNNPGLGVITGDMVNGVQDHCFKNLGPPTVGQRYNLDSVIGWGPQRKYSLSAKFKDC